MTQSEVQRQQAAQRYYDRLKTDLLDAMREWSYMRYARAPHLAVFPWQDSQAVYDLDTAVQGVVAVCREWMEPRPVARDKRDDTAECRFVQAVGQEHDR